MTRARFAESSVASEDSRLSSPYFDCPAAEFHIWRPFRSRPQDSLNGFVRLTNALLILAAACALASWFWEFSTQRYVKGFADAVVPDTASSEQKIEAILNWMSHGPARENT